MRTLQSERERMVEEQLVARGIRDPRVLEVMRTVPRERFVPPDQVLNAYQDAALPLGLGQTISQPYMVADMTGWLDVQPTARVLEIGTGSGYQTMILCRLAAEVYSIERLAELSRDAGQRLHTLGVGNVHLQVGDGTLGWPLAAPFDRILVTAGAPFVPPDLLAQLALPGRMVIPVGPAYEQELYIVDKDSAGKTTTRYATRCRFVPLIGKEGFATDGFDGP